METTGNRLNRMGNDVSALILRKKNLLENDVLTENNIYS